MTVRLKLYPDGQANPVEAVVGLDRDDGCNLCKLSAGPGRSCLPAMGDPGGVLVVVEHPTTQESLHRKPFSARPHDLLRRVVSKAAGLEPVTMAYGVSCPAPTPLKGVLPVRACRPYLARALEECAPRVVIAAGPLAVEAVTGRRIANDTLRGGYTYLEHFGGAQVPVFYVQAPWMAASNRFARRWLEEDVARAMHVVPPLMPIDAEAEVVLSQEQAEEFARAARAVGRLTYDCETSGVMHKADFRVISVACTVGARNWVWDEEALADLARREPLLQVLGDLAVGKVGQDINYDLRCIRLAYGVPVRPVAWDTRLGAKLMDSCSGAKLAELNERVGMGGHKAEADQHVAAACRTIQAAAKAERAKLEAGEAHDAEALARAEDPKAYAYGMVPREPLLRYNALDTLATDLLAQQQQAAPGPQQRVWDVVLSRAVPAFEQVSCWGMHLDRGRLQAASNHFKQRLAGPMTYFDVKGINPNSHPQVQDYLFRKLKLPVQSRTKGGAPSTDAEALLALRGKDPVIEYLLEFALCSKLDGTYATGLLAALGDDGRAHPWYRLDGAATGRTSCAEPNLQNIPNEERNPIEGKLIKDCFTSPPGYKLVEIDNSQIELRIAADQSGDPVMLDIYHSGQDFHLATAQLIAPAVWGISPQDVGPKHRRAAKVVNFSTLFGAGDEHNAHAMGVSVREAQLIRETIFGNFSRLGEWIEEVRAETARTGLAWTWWDGAPLRCRNLWRIGDSNPSSASLTAERGAWNTPVQGTASDYCVMSVAAIVEWVLAEGFPARVTASVHDSVVAEVREDRVEDYVRHAKRIMTGWPTRHGCPLEADAKVGGGWGSMEKFLLPEERTVQILRAQGQPS